MAPNPPPMHRRNDDPDRLDLPLGGERPAAPREPGVTGGPAEWGGRPGAGPEAAVADGAQVPPPARRRWPVALLALLALVVLLVLAGVVGYLLPRPGPPVLRLSTPLVDFGPVVVGATGDGRELTLESTGERPVVIGELALGGPAGEAFEIAADGCSGSHLAPGRSCTAVLRFSPARAAVLRATVEIPAEASNAPLSVAVTGEGVAPEPVVDRRGLEFPIMPVGSPSRPELLTLGNRGRAPLAVEGLRVEGAAAGDFVLDADRCTGESLGPGQECTVRVVFAPGAEGERRALLRFRLGGRPRGAAPFDVALSGVAIGARAADGEGAEPGDEAGAPAADRPAPDLAPAPPPPPELATEPTALDFDEVPIGGEEPREVVLRNLGGGPARIEALSVAGPDAPSFALTDDRCSGRELAAGERCTVGALFRPREEGVQQARLGIASPDLPAGSAPVQVALRGAGAVARLALGAHELDFGEVRVGASVERRLAVANAGRAPLEVRGVELRGGTGGEFGLTDRGCPETVPLAPGERCEVTVRFAPQAEGRRQAELVIRHGGPGAAGRVSLRGAGLPVPAPRAAVAPGAVRFGAVPAAGRSAIETVTLANRGTARMAVGEPRIEGRDAADFVVVPGSCAGASFLVPGSECTVGVRFAPSGPGNRRARLVIPHAAAGERVVVELSGTASP